MFTDEQHKPVALRRFGITYSAAVRDRRRRRRHINAALTGAVVCFGLAMAGTLALLGDGPMSVEEATADVAKAAFAVDPPRPANYSYSESRVDTVEGVVRGSKRAGNSPVGTILRVQQFRRTWLSVTEPGRVQAWSVVGGRRSAEKGTSEPSRFYVIGSERYSAASLAELTHNPIRAVRAIESEVRKAPNPGRGAAAWRLTIEPLRAFAPILPAVVRYALIRSLGTIEGVRVDSSSSNRTTFAIATNGLRDTATFENATATLVETKTIVVRAGAGPLAGSTPGTTLFHYVLLKSRNVARVGDTR